MIERLNQDINRALKAGDRFRLSVLKMVKAALENKRIELGHELSEEECLPVLSKEVKQRHDTAAIYRQAAEEERAAGEEHEAAVIQEYLPQQLSDAELQSLIEQVVNQLGVTVPIGAVIKTVLQKAASRVDGGRVAQAVGAHLKKVG